MAIKHIYNIQREIPHQWDVKFSFDWGNLVLLQLKLCPFRGVEWEKCLVCVGRQARKGEEGKTVVVMENE